MLITRDDFIDKYEVGKTNFDSLDAYIALYEEPFLMDLLGVDLFNAFKTAYTANPLFPANPEFKVILDKFDRDNKGGCPKVVHSRGMKMMVLGLVYLEYQKDVKIQMTSSGPAIDKAEVGEITDSNFVYDRYNESVVDWDAIQWYICKNKSTYPLFNGEALEIAHWSL